MKTESWLAIDTTTDVASVALGSAAHCLQSIRDARRHAAQILPMIEQVLGGLPIAQLAGIVVGDGPGSFTGLRIGWAAAKGLAHESERPVLAVPSLLGLAHAAATLEGSAGPVVVCFDALRGQVFGAMYAFPAGRVETLVAPELFTVTDLVRRAPGRPVQAVGDGAQRYGREVTDWIGRPPLAMESLPAIAGSLLTLAPLVGYPATGEPIYGRPAEAQVKWEARYGRPLPNSSR